MAKPDITPGAPMDYMVRMVNILKEKYPSGGMRDFQSPYPKDPIFSKMFLDHCYDKKHHPSTDWVVLKDCPHPECRTRYLLEF